MVLHSDFYTLKQFGGLHNFFHHAEHIFLSRNIGYRTSMQQIIYRNLLLIEMHRVILNFVTLHATINAKIVARKISVDNIKKAPRQSRR